LFQYHYDGNNSINVVHWLNGTLAAIHWVDGTMYQALATYGAPDFGSNYHSAIKNDGLTLRIYVNGSEFATVPARTKVRRVTLDWKRRTGEGAYIGIYNLDTSSTEWSMSGTSDTGSADATFATPANAFELQIDPSAADLYNTDDYAFVDNVVVYSKWTISPHRRITPMKSFRMYFM
jgi:hypothetical protein